MMITKVGTLTCSPDGKICIEGFTFLGNGGEFRIEEVAALVVEHFAKCAAFMTVGDLLLTSPASGGCA
jgi:hypothetical protein